MLQMLRGFFALERNVVASVIVTALTVAGFGMWSQFMPKYLEALGAPVFAVGALVTMSVISLTFFFAFGGYLSDVYGRKKIFLFATAAGIIDLLIFIFSPNWIFTIPGHIIASMVMGMMITSDSALITESLPKKKRATGRATIQVASLSVLILVAPIGGLLVDHMGVLDGVRQAMFFHIAMIVAAIAIASLMIKETSTKNTRHGFNPNIGMTLKFIKSLPKEVRYLIFSRAFSLFAWGLVTTYFIYYALDTIHVTAVEWGLVGSVAGTVMLISTFTGAKISDMYGRKYAILITFAAAAVVPLLYVMAIGFFQLLLVGAVSGLIGMGLSSVDAYTADHTSRKIRGKSIGITNSLFSIFMIPGPIIGGVIFSVSPQALFLASFFIGLLSIVVGWKLLK